MHTLLQGCGNARALEKVRNRLDRNARINNFSQGQYESCMVCKLRIIFKRTRITAVATIYWQPISDLRENSLARGGG